MDLPTYLYSEDFKEQQMFFTLMFNALSAGLSNNGWTVPQRTMAQVTAIAPFMPDGTIWYVTDHAPPVFAGLIAGTVVQFTTAAYP